MNLARFSAQAERRLREVQPDEIDPEGAGLINLPGEYLEVLEAWDPRDLPQRLSELSEDEAAAYVERHFMLLGVPAERVARATRRLSVADLDAAELMPRKPGRAKRAPAPVAASNVVPIQGVRQ
jgi:type IV secretion system protein VirD4